MLNSFKTSRNRISIYLIDGDEELERTLAAFAAARKNVLTLDYMLLDLSVLNDLGLELDGTAGELPDNEVNRRHRDIISLTVDKVSSLAKASRMHGTVARKLDQAVGRLINLSLSENRLDRSKLAPDLISDLSQPKYQPSTQPPAI